MPPLHLSTANRTKAFGRRCRGQLLNFVVRWRMEQKDTRIRFWSYLRPFILTFSNTHVWGAEEYTFTDDESENEVEVGVVLTGGYEHGELRGYGENIYWDRDDRWSKIDEPKIDRPTIEYPSPRAPTSGHCKASGTMRRSILGGKYPV